MLEGGYCYGPLDPVSNIIVNTVWYDQNFPASKQVTLDMISTTCLWRVAARSLYGLVSFLCTRYQNMSPDQALQQLLVAKCKPDNAVLALVEMQHEAVEGSTPSTSVIEGYAAAATAAFHCNPLAQKEFIGSSDVVSKLRVASEVLHLQDGHPLSCQDLEFLSMSLLKCSSSTSKSCQEEDLAPTKIRKSLYSYIAQCSYRFWGQHERVTSMVKAALDKFNETLVGGSPHLGFILSVVPMSCIWSEPSMDGEVGGYNPWTRDKYYHTHINFLAVCEGHPHDPPRLFFAECGKDGDDTCWCIPTAPQKPDAGMF
ncbi:hypothetical protein HU200_003952 [Digitaria exilis]|uniref:Uncharacterized protein n=1 Tax=Digitaria exilis TaxID=1010633 RepID=A0A835KVG9_9POAL|nr:hypothetical protein HU200_003952 [Digitaria exilis]